jgi:hypothetical protein
MSLTAIDPDILTLPVNSWLSFIASPNLLLPLLYITDELTVCTIKVFA